VAWDDQRRRTLAAGAAMLGSVLLAGGARAQAAKRTPLVGVLCPGSTWTQAGNALDLFRQGLHELGRVDGRDLRIEARFDDYSAQRSAAQVDELIALGADVLVAGTTGSAQLARRASARVPIVMAVSADPVGDGLVESLARPGGNVTGMSIMSPELTARRLQLMAELRPGLSRVTLLVDPLARVQRDRAEHEQAALALGLALTVLDAGQPEDFEPAFAAARKLGADAVVLPQTVRYAMHVRELAAAAASQRMPAVSGAGDRAFARAGGLANFGVNIGRSWHRAASFVHRILAGATPAELPVEQPTRFELAINRRAADALGLAIPPNLLLLADEVVR
jgi:putative ABC transport system substrate-binding protein